MIQLQRPRTPQTVSTAMRGAQRRKKNRLLVDAWARGAIDAFEFESSKWKAAKAQLKADTHGKCAYCESQTTVVAHGDVEHFRPKSRYWWLAFCLDNYCFSCQLCNQTWKGAQWEFDGPEVPRPAVLVPPAQMPAGDDARDRIATQMTPDPLHEAQGRPWDAFWQELRAERARLLHPYDDDPTPFFAWKEDLVQRHVKLVAADASERARQIVSASERLLGLNRPELMLLRYGHFKDAASAARALKSTDPDMVADGRERAVAMTADSAAYAGMVRWYFEKWHIDWRALGSI